MSSYDTKKEMGLGTWSLILGLLPTALTAQYNGVSLLKLAMDAVPLSYAPWMTAFGLVLSIPGLILGSSCKKDYGAKFGTFLCGFNAIFTVSQIIVAYLK